MSLLIFTIILQKKVKKIEELRQTNSRQNYLDIINSLKKIFHEQSDTNTHDLETEKSPADKSTRTRFKNTNTKPNG